MKDKIYNPQDNISNPHIKDFDQYKAMYEESINNPKSFFGNMANDNLNWIEPFAEVHNDNFSNATRPYLEGPGVIAALAIVRSKSLG